MTTVIGLIASNCNWHKNIKDAKWLDQCEQNLDYAKTFLPKGSGIDAGCEIDIDKSSYSKVIITFDFHVMDDNGYYAGWLKYKVIATTDFSGLKLKIVGSNKYLIKDYLHDTFYEALTKIIN